MMRKNDLFEKIEKERKQGNKLFAVLIDPDKFSDGRILQRADDAGADIIMVGGSLLSGSDFTSVVASIRKSTHLPVVIFPGNQMQVSSDADAILLLSLISGRNPDFLIGQHVHSAPSLKRSGIEIIPTGYMLIDGGRVTAAQYMSSTQPIPSTQDDIAACTALAGEMLGLRMIYLDAGSGAKSPVSASMIRKTRETVSLPLIVGGGITTPELAVQACEAGADIIVVGNAIEKDITIIASMSAAIHSLSKA
jgi:putative glycerol-1-phosphate prenyltransferase